MTAVHLMQGEIHAGPRQARPLDGRVTVRIAGVEDVAVLDEREGPHYERRDILEAGVGSPGELNLVYGLAAAIQDT